MADFKMILEKVRSENPDLSYIEARKLASAIAKKEDSGKSKKKKVVNGLGNNESQEINTKETEIPNSDNLPKSQPKVVYLDDEEEKPVLIKQTIISPSYPNNDFATNDVSSRIRDYVNKTGVKVIVTGRLMEVGISQEDAKFRTSMIFGNVRMIRNTTSDLNWKIIL